VQGRPGAIWTGVETSALRTTSHAGPGKGAAVRPHPPEDQPVVAARRNCVSLPTTPVFDAVVARSVVLTG
jgi:hypothetical protein